MATNPYANVTEIVFQNNRFPLNGASVEEVLKVLMKLIKTWLLVWLKHSVQKQSKVLV